MPTDHIVALLIEERDRLTRAIEALQGPTKRVGRPPKNPLAVAAAPAIAGPAPDAPAKRNRTFSAAHRKMLSRKLKAYWKRRKAQEPKE